MNDKDMNDITGEDFVAFDEVRRYGRWNMFDPMAKKATGLDNDTYFGVIHHYNELKEKYKSEIQDMFNKRTMKGEK